MRIALLGAVAFVACDRPLEPAQEPPSPQRPILLDAVHYLDRASIALRGVRASPAEIEAVAADPAAVDAIVEDYLESDEFLLVMRDLHAEMLLVRTDATPQFPTKGALTGYSRGEVYESITSEPLQLVEHVIANDLPYTELVTADYGFTDEIGSKVWGLPYDPQGPEWQQVTWHDGRPGAGLLSSPWMMVRHESNASNYHRSRAAMVASTFLCADFESRDIPLSGNIDIADQAVVADALMDNPSCVSCHQSLDPLAAVFWGFRSTFHPGEISGAYDLGCGYAYYGSPLPTFSNENPPSRYCYPLEQYTPADEGDWAVWNLRPPGYYGQPADNLSEVGEHIADDPRFAQCIARRFFGWLAQVEPAEVPIDVAAGLQETFVASGFSARALAHAVVTHESFRAVGNTGPEAAPTESLRVTRPQQLARMIEDLTGYRWTTSLSPAGCDRDPKFGNTCWPSVDVLDNDVIGYRAMSGGIDGFYVVRPVHAITPVKLLALEQLAWDAAGFVVDADFANPAPPTRRLLQRVEPTTTDEAQVRDQLAWLVLRVLGEPVDPASPEVDALYLLFSRVADRQGTTDAWKTTIGALLQDPRMLLY